MKKLIAGNWKMNGTLSDISHINQINACARMNENLDTALFVPSIYLMEFAKNSEIIIGSQDCHHKKNGAYTGDISVDMLCDIGIKWTLIGHSERREYHSESDDIISQKVNLAIENKINVILCIGESLEDYKSGNRLDFVRNQLLESLPKTDFDINYLTIAYEPIWAIGTGLVPNASEISDMHNMIHGILNDKYGDDANQIRILYGGSVNADNADMIKSCRNIGGVLVGGASLKADSFCAIIEKFA